MAPTRELSTVTAPATKRPEPLAVCERDADEDVPLAVDEAVLLELEVVFERPCRKRSEISDWSKYREKLSGDRNVYE